MIQLTAVAPRNKSLHNNFLADANRTEVFDAQVGCDSVFRMKPASLAHDFVQQNGDDSTMKKSGPALVFIAELKTSDDALARAIYIEGKFHAPRVRSAAAEALVFRFGI